MKHLQTLCLPLKPLPIRAVESTREAHAVEDGGFACEGGFEGFEDGFAPPAQIPGGGHSRTMSRVDSSWRISECDSYL